MSNAVNKNEGVLSYIDSVGGLNGSGGGAPRASGGTASSGASWFLAMSRAWGSVLDNQAGEVIRLSESLGAGQDNPSQAALLTASAHRMSYLSQSAATSQNSAAQAIENISKRN